MPTVTSKICGILMNHAPHPLFQHPDGQHTGGMWAKRFLSNQTVWGHCDNMAVGFVLISTAPTKEHEVYSKLLKIPEIVELYPLFGDYDLIAKLETDDYNRLGQIVVEAIRGIDGVIDTKTLTGINF